MKAPFSGLGYELVSTGGSANAIEGAGVPVTRVEELTGFPEMLDGEPGHTLKQHPSPSPNPSLSIVNGIALLFARQRAGSLVGQRST